MTTENIHPGRKKRKWGILWTVIILLILARLALPYVVLHYANKMLASMHGYYGKIKDIDLAVYRGAYKIKKMYLHKKDTVSNLETEFFDTQEVDLSIHWAALLRGKIVGELELEEPTLRFIKDKTDPAQIQKDTNDFRHILDKFMPLRVNRFEIHNGIIKYIDKSSNPKVDIEMNNAFVAAENLTNVRGESTLPSTVTASSDVYEGTLDLSMRLDPLAKDPTFDMNTELKSTNLTKLNDFFKAYGKFDVSKGSFGLYVEMASKDGKFEGYAKPIIKDLKVLGPEDKNKDILHKFWESFVGGIGIVFRNQKHDQVASKIPIAGTFGKTKVYIWRAILEILKNAFVEALKPSLDNDVSLDSVGDTGDTGIKINKHDKAGKKEEDAQQDQKQGQPGEDKKERKGFFKKLFNKKDKKEKADSSNAGK